jgi:hypothetical protein
METLRTLGDLFPKEIARCRELLEQYRAIGPAGTFGATMIANALEQAEQAQREQDPVRMMMLYKELITFK